jgi:hypothetical protein
MKAQKKPVVIDYLPYDGKNWLTVEMWVKEFGDSFSDHFFVESVGDLKVKTLEGTSYDVTSQDVIIRGVKGEYYPCKVDIFDQTYQRL